MRFSGDFPDVEPVDNARYTSPESLPGIASRREAQDWIRENFPGSESEERRRARAMIEINDQEHSGTEWYTLKELEDAVAEAGEAMEIYRYLEDNGKHRNSRMIARMLAQDRVEKLGEMLGDAKRVAKNPEVSNEYVEDYAEMVGDAYNKVSAGLQGTLNSNEFNNSETPDISTTGRKRTAAAD